MRFLLRRRVGCVDSCCRISLSRCKTDRRGSDGNRTETEQTWIW